MVIKGGSTHTIGRRKSAVARLFMKPGSGKFIVNGSETLSYFGRPNLDLHLREPLRVAQAAEKYDFVVNVDGGGKSGQAGAVRLAVARALVKLDESVRGVLRQAGVLTRDPREVERKKYGLRKARRRAQYSKR